VSTLAAVDRPLKNDMSLFSMNEFAPYRESCIDDANELCRREIRTTNNMQLVDWWVYSLALIALFTGSRVLAVFALVTREGDW
jgi:hypothetical protein